MREFQPLHGGQLREISDCFAIPVSELLDFSANINPEGPPASVPVALRHAIEVPSVLADYPDLEETELRTSLACYCRVQAGNVAVANGFVPLLDAALQVLFVRTCLVPVPAFVEYRRALERSNIKMIPHVFKPDLNFNCEAADLFSAACDAILLANPQNPSGVLYSREAMLRIIEEAADRKMHVLLDEAFIDYCPEASLAHEIDRFPNLVVFRSVTKFFGIAGLRVAYAAANAALCKRLQKSIALWSITTLASLAAMVAVRDEAYVRHTILLNNDRRGRLQNAISKLGIRVYPSAANFLLLRLPGSIDGQHFWERMIREHQIVLRNCANYEGLRGPYLRASVRTEAENERLVKALACEVEKRP